MFSSMNEFIKFDKEVDPWLMVQKKEEGARQQKGKTQYVIAEVREVRPIEVWLLEVEEQMRSSLPTTIIQGTLDFKKMPKQEWVFAWPQQTILVLD